MISFMPMNEIQKAILKTLIYYDLFDWPANLSELTSFLIGEKATCGMVEKQLQVLAARQKVSTQDGFWMLKDRNEIVPERLKKEKEAQRKLKIARKAAAVLKIIPWIEMVAISGTLAVGGAKEDDDIDIFILTQTGRLYLSRLFEFLLLTLLGKRRRPRTTKVKDKICPNLYLDYEGLLVAENLCAAHDLVRLKPLWERNGAYRKLLEANLWYQNYFPNRQPRHCDPPAGGEAIPSVLPHSNGILKQVQDDKEQARDDGVGTGLRIFGDWFESLARKLELRYLQSKKTSERISAHTLYFHPQDVYPKILKEFQKRILPLDKK